MPALKFPKSWLRTLGYRQKIHHFFFSHKWGTRFKYLSKLCPYILMYSALHIMQWFSQVLDVFTPKIKWKFFDFYILWSKTNVAYTRLEMIARTKYCTTTTASNWFVTLYYKLLPAVRSPSKHGRWRSSLLLYSISMSNMNLAILCLNANLDLTQCSYWSQYTKVMCTYRNATIKLVKQSICRLTLFHKWGRGIIFFIFLRKTILGSGIWWVKEIATCKH